MTYNIDIYIICGITINVKMCTDPQKVGPRNPTFGGLLMAKYSYEKKPSNKPVPAPTGAPFTPIAAGASK